MRIKGNLDAGDKVKATRAIEIPQWQPNTYYAQGDMVQNGSLVYVAKSNFTSGGAFDVSNWEPTRAQEKIMAFEPVRVASTANVDINTGLVDGSTIDGVTLTAGDRVLLKDQTNQSENGLYSVVSSGAGTRTSDADAEPKVTKGKVVYVEEGTTNGGKYFSVDTAPSSFATDPTVFKKAVTDLDIPPGGLAKKGVVTSDADSGEGIYTLDASGGAFNFTLPSATGSQERRMFFCQNVANNNVTIKVQSGESLNGVTDGTYIANINGEVLLATDQAPGKWEIDTLDFGESTPLDVALVYLSSHANLNASGQTVPFNTVSFSAGIGNITYNLGVAPGVFNLKAGKRYKLVGNVFGNGGLVRCRWYQQGFGYIGIESRIQTVDTAISESIQSTSIAIVEPTTDITVQLFFLENQTRTIFANHSYALIEELPKSKVMLPENMPVSDNTGTSGGYFDIGNMRIQWGIENNTTWYTLATLPAPFANTDYSIVASVDNFSNTAKSVVIANKRTTDFQHSVYDHNGNVTAGTVNWVAIGLKP